MTLDRQSEIIPVYVLKDRAVSPLEAISEYLKDMRNMTYHQIAELVNRDDRTIWTCYNRAKKKRSPGGVELTKVGGIDASNGAVEGDADVKGTGIPSDILKNRKLAPLEAISMFLKDSKDMTFHQIAELVNRDDRTIWTSYHRGKKKIDAEGLI